MMIQPHSSTSTSPSPSLGKIAMLTGKAQRRTEQLREIDWSAGVLVPGSVRPAVYVDMVSQLYWAERVALEVLERMRRELPEAEAGAFLATQVDDEARHAALYLEYLQRLGELAPRDPGLGEVFHAAMQWNGPAWGRVVALNVMMEHEALHQQKRRIATLPCPLFKQVNRQIADDESRHAAFGVLYLEHAVPRAEEGEKAEVMRWLGQLWGLWQQANRGRYQAEGEEVLRLDAEELAHRGRRVTATLASLGLGSQHAQHAQHAPAPAKM